MFDAEAAAGIHVGRIVVGFAGGGGSSFGVRAALGTDPHLAMNHWEVAVQAHARHFPDTFHLRADVYEVDPSSVFPGEDIGLGWFSPDCTDHSKAKGQAPKSERIRGLAWSIIPWAKRRKVRVLLLENVEEFAQWGPVYRRPDDWRAKGVPGEVGQPIVALRGLTFWLFRRRLAQAGYWFEWRNRLAADFGVPTTRKRLIGIAVYVGEARVARIALGLEPSPIPWPEPTHAPRHKAKALGRRPWRGACECIDFSRRSYSIFLTADEVKAQKLPCRRPLVKATMGRVARGYERFVARAAKPFLISIDQRKWGGERAHDMRDPLPTATASRGGQFAVSAPVLTSVAHGDDWPRAGLRAWSVDDPIRTVTGQGERALMSAFLAPRYGEREGQAPRAIDIAEPHPTVVPDGNGGRLAVVHLTQHNHGEVPFSDAIDPLRVVTAQGQHHGLVSAFIAQGNFENEARDVQDPLTTITGRATQQQLITAYLGSYYAVGEGSDLAEPMRAATGRDRHALTVGYLEQANTGMVGHDAREPLSTLVGKGCTQRLVQARLALEGGPTGRRADVLAFLWDHFGQPTAEEWADPVATEDGRLKFGLVLIEGRVWMVVDITLRMLAADELALAMGVPAGVDFTEDANGKPISKVNQTQMIGNMVCPDFAAAHVRAVRHLIWPGQGVGA